MGGKKVAGIVAIILGVALAAFDLVYYMGRHPRRGIAIIVVGAVLLVVGIILLVVRGGTSQTQSGA